MKGKGVGNNEEKMIQEGTGKEPEAAMENSHRFFENRACQYFPCHKELVDFNCLFCYCPFYGKKNCPGAPRYIEADGKRIKDCTDCVFPHRPENYDRICRILSETAQEQS